MQSGCRWVYTLMDWDTGEVVAKGTSVELVEQGYFPDVNKLSSVWNNLEKCKNPSPKNYRWKMERKSTKDDRMERARAEGLSADERAETRMVRVYSCYGADGTLLGKGTAAELKDKGLFGSEGTVHECYRKRGGVYKPGGVTRMEMELCQKRIRHPMKLPDQPAKVKRKPIGGVIDPSALAYDVHDLMIYNENSLAEIQAMEVIYGDASKPYVLEEARADRMDIAIALTQNDEDNLVICELCKKRFGTAKTLALVNDPKKTEFFYSMGIDSVVCAINVVAGIIEQQAFMDEMATRIPLGSGRVGITEVFISPTAPAAEKRIWELDLPRDAIIGCILRGEESMIPRGDNRIFPGDTLVVISTSDQEKEVIRKLTGR